MSILMTRRNLSFLAGTTATAALIPGRVLGANGKVNLAAIGIGQQGGSILRMFAQDPNVNVVALCDVDIDSDKPIGHWAKGQYGWMNQNQSPAANASKFPKARKFTDFRKMFDRMGDEIDAVCIGVPDHSHFPISMAAMMLGKHVYVEKPLARTFLECELLKRAEAKYGVATQMGNQGHSGNNYHQFKAWKEAGIIKDVTHVDAQMNSSRRWHKWGEISEFPSAQKAPKGLDWNLWQGPVARKQGFSERLHYGNWRGWHQYGTGCFGDWGAHILDTIHEFLELGLPERISATTLTGQNDYIFPLTSTINFQFPARGDMPAMDIDWYDGRGNAAPVPEGATLKGPGKFIYSKEYTFQGGHHNDTLQIIPYEAMRELLKAGKLPKASAKGKSTHHENFILACKGIEKTRSPFSVSAPLCQTFTLGCIAQRLGGTLEFDRENLRITNNKRANSLLKDEIRRGWEQYYKL